MKKILIFIILLLFLDLSCSKEHSDIKIGVVLPISGKMAKYGKTSEAALKAMSDIINSKRTKKDYPKLRLIIEDDQLDAKVGVNAITKLINSDKVSAVIGAMASSITLAMAPIAEKNKVVLISPGSSSPKITNAGDYIFRTVLSDIYEGKKAAEIYGHFYKGRSLGILYINNDYGVGLKGVFENNVHYNGKILEYPYDANAKDFRTILTKIKYQRLQVVYLVGYDEMIQIFNQARELGLKNKWIGTNQLNDQSLITQMGDNADGTIFPAWKFDLNYIKSNFGNFYKKYLGYSDGLSLDIFSANAADALMVLNYAIGNKNYTGPEIKTALYSVKNFSGLTGNLSFDKNGDVVKDLDLDIIKNGKIIKLNKQM